MSYGTSDVKKEFKLGVVGRGREEFGPEDFTRVRSLGTLE